LASGGGPAAAETRNHTTKIYIFNKKYSRVHKGLGLLHDPPIKYHM
jgi:hypothetical protein